MPGFYDQVKRTVANSDVFVFPEDATPHFPSERVDVGKLFGPKVVFPALVDLRERGSIFQKMRQQTDSLRTSWNDDWFDSFCQFLTRLS